MKQFILFVICIAESFGLTAQAGPEDLLGKWTNEEKTSTIEFQKTEDAYSARIVWMAEPSDSQGNPKLDRHNPDQTKRDQPVLGMTIITGLHFDGETWTEGKIYAPGRGIYANCCVYISEGKLHLEISKGPFTSTKIWSKAS
ncbi:DUF2147 domain-containing protein [Mangrovibacterium diazotrophicum]|uniref:Uncharacterized protein (DUF2147 family) n=1 Tax=Mangrovibacterium diazotrophicum TaxID=1261403 RepID=A0A419W481_9BACT|nr:DUF2147 domain-containing protein [Mangrovibacterium diazotrophicum]RKD90250.1 uncharacterized protein (DUF2147 family) [Mangrovibacterium diazotrophicum]